MYMYVHKIINVQCTFLSTLIYTCTHTHINIHVYSLIYIYMYDNAHTNRQAHASALSHENEQLKLQVAEMAIIAQIKRGGDGSGGQDSSEAVLEKYYEAKRELETLKQRVGSEYEDEIERLTAAKKSLEKKVGVARLAFTVEMV